MSFPEAPRLLNNAGVYLKERGQYTEAQQLLLQALKLRRLILGLEHIDVAESLSGLAWLYYDLGRFKQAEELFYKTLEMRKKLLGMEHQDVVTSINDLGLLYREQSKDAQAE